jgi:translation initiation factor IF-3
MATAQALGLAQDADLDLVEVNANSRPPICKIMDFSKLLYEMHKQKKKELRHERETRVKEVRLTSNIQMHDYDNKVSRISRFLSKGHQTKVTIVLFGRNRMHSNLAYQLLERIEKDLSEIAHPLARPRAEGNRISILFSPVKK